MCVCWAERLVIWAGVVMGRGYIYLSAVTEMDTKEIDCCVISHLLASVAHLSACFLLI
jgi:hypothetical protein